MHVSDSDHSKVNCNHGQGITKPTLSDSEKVKEIATILGLDIEGDSRPIITQLPF